MAEEAKVPRDRYGRIILPSDAWRDNEEEQARLQAIIDGDNVAAAVEVWEQQGGRGNTESVHDSWRRNVVRFAATFDGMPFWKWPPPLPEPFHSRQARPAPGHPF